MGFQDAGAAWRKSDRNGEPFYSIQIDLEVLGIGHGKRTLFLRRNTQKKSSKHPDFRLSVADDDDRRDRGRDDRGDNGRRYEGHPSEDRGRRERPTTPYDRGRDQGDYDDGGEAPF